jgi:hypothetical protein
MIIGPSDAARARMHIGTARLKRHAGAAHEVAYDSRGTAAEMD